MTSKEFIKQQIAAGYKIHFHKGVWWQREAPFCYKPVVNLGKIVPGESRPIMLKSFLKYSHAVSDAKMANRFWPVMLLNNEKLKEFSIKSLSSSKRARVRKGLRLIEVKRIERIEPLINDLKDICISTAIRTKHGKPPEYYVKNFKKWSSWITKEFYLPDREWFGAYYENCLVAYIYSVLIDETMYNFTAKSHTDFLDKCPNDALIFSFLEYCRNLDECSQVIFGDWGENLASLNRFKEHFGFQKVELPMHVWFNPIFVLLRKYVTKIFQK